MDKVREFIVESNNIEGVFDEASHERALMAWDYLVKQDELTLNVVLKTHEILMVGKLANDELGNLRKIGVRVGDRTCPPAYEVRDKINNWLDRMAISLNIGYSEAGKKEMSKSLHVLYERIHPFVDGNGRTGRMFMNWWRLKRGLDILVIKNAEKQDYYKWFK